MPEQKLVVPACPRHENGHWWRFDRERSTTDCQADVCQACGLVWCAMRVRGWRRRINGEQGSEAQPGRPALAVRPRRRRGDLDGAGQAVVPAVRRYADPDEGGDGSGPRSPAELPLVEGEGHGGLKVAALGAQGRAALRAEVRGLRLVGEPAPAAARYERLDLSQIGSYRFASGAKMGAVDPWVAFAWARCRFQVGRRLATSRRRTL